jgi:hypothetical protein
VRAERVPPEMENKILYGTPAKNYPTRIIGGHSADIKNRPEYKVRVLGNNPDGTTDVKMAKKLSDGSWSEPKPFNADGKHTLAPDSWTNKKIIDTTHQGAESPVVATRSHDGATFHLQKVEGVEWAVIKDNTGKVTASYPTGGVGGLPSGFK